MKILLITLSILSATASLAQAQVAGKYEKSREINARFINSKEECLEERGKWVNEDEGCIVKVSDTISINKTKKSNVFNTQIGVFGGNFHMCMIEGKATLKGSLLTLSVKTEDYNTETDSLVHVTCVVKAAISKDGQTIDISSNEKCRSFCGANAWLESTGLKKVK